MNLLSFIVLFLFQSLNPEPQTGSIDLQIHKAKSNQGVIRVLIFQDSEGFPEEASKAYKALTLPVSNFSTSLKIEKLPPGNYVFSVFHDENEDGEMLKTIFGFPLERYGFSNNPTALFSIPSFDKCAVILKKGESKTVRIELH